MRRVAVVLLLFAAFASSGCCCHRKRCGKTNDWCGCGCGETYWHEWFSDPPTCKDPCDRCGNYCGCRHGGPGQFFPGAHPGPTVADQGGEIYEE